ncbi:Variable large protein 5 (plasmid) [Borrelia turicatae]|uniref:Variable large protein n=1 Tax=Borrelia turicatae TaxID=142 RepID=A0A172XD40_BORTU|nr:Variable large protein 5 [Borrelia turicatae]UPA15762.1 variable large family protein [Borrelia turicatae]
MVIAQKIMTLFLLLGCGSGSSKAEDLQSRFLKSLISLGNDFLNVFTSLSDMVGGVLGFNTTTKKSDVGNYFKRVHDTLSFTKVSLEKIVGDMKVENNPNAASTETAVKTLVDNTLIKIIEGAKTVSEAIGTTGDDLLGNFAAGGAGAAAGAKGDGIENLVEGIKGIVEVVLQEGNPESGTDKKAEDGSTARTANGDGEAGKLFDAANAGDAVDKAKKSAADATKAVGAVTGADILKAIVKDGSEASTNAAKANAKDATIAGAIALRAMAKGGKFANGDNADDVSVVKGAAVSAVTKVLGTLTITIRNTIDSGLKTVQDAMKINSTDILLTTDNTTSETKKN